MACQTVLGYFILEISELRSLFTYIDIVYVVVSLRVFLSSYIVSSIPFQYE